MLQFLSTEDIYLEETATEKEEAIRLAGKYMVERGYVTEEYIEKMVERENIVTTYIGNDIAIPHGTEEGKQYIKTSGVVVLKMVPEVPFDDGEKAKFVMGIAGKNGEHMDILSNIAIVCSEKENVEKLYAAKTKEEILEILGGK